MKVQLTSPVEGKQPGESAEVDEERGRWLISAGYAVESKAEPKKAPKEEPKAEPKAQKKPAPAGD